MKKVLFDSNGLQTSVHLGIHFSQLLPNPKQKALDAKCKRLATFISIIENCDCEVEFTPYEKSTISDDMLNAFDMLVITTRIPRLPKQPDCEINAIYRFVQKGGSLLIMSDHPFQNKPHPIPDIYVASIFDVTLNPPVYPSHGGRCGLTEIRDNDIHSHAITDGIQSIVFNNGCRIGTSRRYVLATLPGEASAFAVAIDFPYKDYGRVVITSDSGFVADDNTNFPGPGLISRGNNEDFIQQAIEWLLKLR